MKFVLALLISFIVISGVAGFIYSGLTQIGVETFTLSSVQSLTTGGFSLSGTLGITNPSIISVTVESITYDLVLNHTREVLSKGSFDSFVLAAGKVTEVPFTHTTNWVPPPSLALELMGQKNVYMIFEGTAVIDILGLYTHEAPIEVAVDIKNLLISQARNRGLGLP